MAVNKGRIAKNSIWLFFRMGVTVLVSLFTSRIVLDALGASDYGLYNVVGGIIIMLSFVTGSMSQGVQRFVNSYLAIDDHLSVNKVISASYIILACFAIIVLVLGETIGLWFLNEKLNIELGRLIVANWIYQFSICTFLLNLFKVPLQGLITAHEDFGIYARFSIVDVILKLCVAFYLYYTDEDKLLVYGFLIFVTQWILPIFMTIFCKRKYTSFYFSICKDKYLYKELLNFSGWNLLGTSASLFSVQCVNIILNIFFGTVVNAARGIANQVTHLIDDFINNVQYAANPQIQQLYSKKDMEGMFMLMYDNFKWNFMLYWLIALPCLFKMNFIISLWLKEVPQYTVIFAQISIVRCLLKCFERPLNTCLFAVGKMKWVNIISSMCLFSELFIAYVLFFMGFAPYWCFLVDILVVLAIVLFNTNFCRMYTHFVISKFFVKVIKPIIIVILLSVLPIYTMNMIITETTLQVLLLFALSTILNTFLFYFILLSKSNRTTVNKRVVSFFKLLNIK